MRTKSLGPHTFLLPETHPRHPEWLTHFTPSERRQLIEEDCAARTRVFQIMAGILVSGIIILLFALQA